MWLSRYRSAVRATVAASAAPYGYTLTVWTSGAVLAHARGLPSTQEALFFLLGAVTAYVVVGLLAFGSFHGRLVPEATRSLVWGGLHLFSVGLAIGAATVVAHLLEDVAAWPVGGFCGTAIYLSVSGLQLMFAHGRPPSSEDGRPPGRDSASREDQPDPGQRQRAREPGHRRLRGATVEDRAALAGREDRAERPRR